MCCMRVFWQIPCTIWSVSGHTVQSLYRLYRWHPSWTIYWFYDIRHATLYLQKMRKWLGTKTLSSVLKFSMALWLLLTPSLRRSCIHAIFFPTACRTACKHAFCFLRVRPGSRVNTPLVAVTNVGWRVYTPVFLGVLGTRFGAPGQKGTAVREWVNGMEWVNGFLPNPFIHHRFCGSSRHKFIKTVL